MVPRIGFIGGGSFASSCIYPALQIASSGPNPICELVAVCDLYPALAERAQKRFGFQRFYTDHKEMLANESLDAVFIVMHPRLMPALAIEVMQSGANAYVEKPPAQTLAEVRDMQRVSRETGKFCQVGFMKRFSEPYTRAKEITSRPGFGEPSVYESRKARLQPYPPVYDYLNDFVCHHIDLTRYFMGDVDYVYAEFLSRTHDPHGYNAKILAMADVYTNWAKLLEENPHVPQSDGYLINFRFTSGNIGVHNANTLEVNSNMLERVIITGEGGVVAAEDWRYVKAYIRDQDPIYWEPLLIDTDMQFKLHHAGYVGEVTEFVTATSEGRATHAASIDDGVACLEIIAAVRRSIDEGRRVHIAEFQTV
jgi:predicted dehydrogenase